MACSVRKIARTLGIHRNTVKRHLESETFPQYRKQKRQPSSLEPYYPMIRDFLEEDDYQATWIFDRLRKAGYRGCYVIVRDYVRSIKEQKTRLAYIRFETGHGHQAQFDRGEFHIMEPSGRGFACRFLQTPPHGDSPCGSANGSRHQGP
jgi:transposase